MKALIISLIVIFALIEVTLIISLCLYFRIFYNNLKGKKEALEPLKGKLYVPFEEQSRNLISEALAIPFEQVYIEPKKGRKLAGRYYFNNIEHRGTYADIPFDIKRSMIRGRAIKFPEGWQVAGFTNAGAGNKPALASGQPLYIAPISFCDIQLGMDMFRDAHHYFAAVSKNVEAYNNIAVEINDGEFLTDQELFAKLLTTIREKYNGSSTKSLPAAQRLDLARTLHYDYHSSNGQIRRILGLTQFEVDSLFPLRK